MPKTIEQLKTDLATFRSSKGQGTSTPVAPVPSAAPAAPVSSTNEGIGAELANYRSQRDSGTLPAATAIPKDDPNALSEFAKGLVSAPATIVARPFQAAAELAGASAEDVDAATKKIPLFGGLVAPVPQNGGDVVKDVGRAAQTVALGLDAPIAAGALFGGGASLEAGNDLLSAQTAFDVALGAAGGKVLDLVGRPLLNAAGKVVGTITPKVIRDVAAGGAKAIAEFAARHDLPTSAVTKPLSESIQKGARAIDNGINTGVSKTAGALKKTAAEQFPHLNPQAHYTAVNEKDFLRPTTVNEPRFAKPTAIYQDAKSRGIDLEKTATNQGIIHDKIAEGGKYNTVDVVENLREGNYRASDSLLRPAIKASEPGVRLVPISEVRTAMIERVQNLPKSSIDPQDRTALIKQITKRYAPGSAADVAHPNGYSLTDLHDARIAAGKKGKYVPGVSDPASTLAAKRSREEERAFSSLFDTAAPDDLPAKAFKKELEKNFILADYLQSLHGKRVPEGITKKAVRLFGRGLGGVLGSKIGGFPGFLVGSRGGDIIFNSFETLPNPIKIQVLQSLKKSDPEVFKALIEYIGKEEAQMLTRLALPPAGGSSFKEPQATLFTTPKGKSTPNKSEAFDITAVEQGRAKAPTTNRAANPYKAKVRTLRETAEPYTHPSELPVIQTGGKGKKIMDILGTGGKSPLDIAEQHVSSAKQILANLDPAEISSLGGMGELLKRTKINIVDGLKAEGLAAQAAKLDKLDVSTLSTIEQFDEALKKAFGVVKQAGLKEIY